MNNNGRNPRCTAVIMFQLLGAALALLLTAPYVLAQSSTVPKQAEPAPSKFYCNRNALSPTEREHQTKLTAKLFAAKTRIVELPNGYELQFTPAAVTLAELADWVSMEGRCCKFFDFHIDLEREGTLICLRLTGDEGIKQFARSEFQLAPK